MLIANAIKKTMIYFHWGKKYKESLENKNQNQEFEKKFQ